MAEPLDWRRAERFNKKASVVRGYLETFERMEGEVPREGAADLMDMVEELEALARNMRRVVAEVMLVSARAKQAQLLEAYNEAREGGGPLVSPEEHAEWTERRKLAEEALAVVNDVVTELEEFGGIRQA
jgi:hypothetical protein